MCQEGALLQGPEGAQSALVEQVGHVLQGVLGPQVHLVGAGLDGGVGTVGALVGPQPAVPHLVSPQRVVVGRRVVTLATSERFVPRVLPHVQLQRGAGGGGVATKTTQTLLSFFMHGFNMKL